MRRIGVGILLLALLLSGCAGYGSGYYSSVQRHPAENAAEELGTIAVSNYSNLLTTLGALVEDGVESATLTLRDYDPRDVENDLARAGQAILRDNPIAAYAAEDIAFEQGTSGGVAAAVVRITYNHDRGEIRRIVHVDTMDAAMDAVCRALDACEAGKVLLVEQYREVDIAQRIQNYAGEHPEKIIEIPEVAVSSYPDSGTARVIELKFNYQTSRESLRTMQLRVQSVFASARLYVSGDAEEHEMFSQLCAFLMNRFSTYRLETSITAPYSLLCHGVGDSRAFAEAYAAMCRQVGLDCQVVSGTRDGAPWFWNIVCDEGSYCHVDLLYAGFDGGYWERADAEMAGYVWDYAAYPPCSGRVIPEETEAATVPETTEATAPTQAE